MKYDFHPDARLELEDAATYYDNINRELATSQMNYLCVKQYSLQHPLTAKFMQTT